MVADESPKALERSRRVSLDHVLCDTYYNNDRNIYGVHDIYYVGTCGVYLLRTYLPQHCRRVNIAICTPRASRLAPHIFMRFFLF